MDKILDEMEVMYLKSREDFWKKCLINHRFYIIIELPFIIKQIEVQIEITHKLSDLRKNNKSH